MIIHDKTFAILSPAKNNGSEPADIKSYVARADKTPSKTDLVCSEWW